ncbi:glycosyl transferase family 11 domain-containing protein [Ditylenchus destructor]|uniref:Glycosyl transferase family 11 domain-containing protein n=1 Tax=Ditylenchus destructor TaxID=166010 RepID=A0AAD4QZC2_9BILA|nr:glycosyl transferase family 11 domain-containing protein [Ditylenchus destructor]
MSARFVVNCLILVIVLSVLISFYWRINVKQTGPLVWDEGTRCFFQNFPKNTSGDDSNLNSTWYALLTNVNKCFDKYYKHLDIMRVTSTDDVKFFLKPAQSPYPCNIVTLGVGHDITSEKILQKIYPKCTFLGADPSEPTNREMYEKDLGGQFIHTAVGAYSSEAAAKVVEQGDKGWAYNDQMVRYRGIVDFLNEYRPGEMIDLLLIDTEGGEYDILKVFAESSPALPIVCQMSLEFHFDPAHRRPGVRVDHFFDTIRRLILSKRFALMHIEESAQVPNMGLFKAFILNIKDQKCIEKYFGAHCKAHYSFRNGRCESLKASLNSKRHRSAKEPPNSPHLRKFPIQKETVKEPPAFGKFITTVENCEGFGNQLWRVASLYAIGKKLNRSMYFEQNELCMTIFEQEFALVFPTIYRNLHFFTPRNQEQVDFASDCCTYDDVSKLNNSTAHAIQLRGNYLQSYKFFDWMRMEILEFFQFSESLRKNVDHFKKMLFDKDLDSHKLCVHTRQGDFVALGYQSKLNFTEYAINKAFDTLKEKFEDISVILLGEDKRFLRKISYDKEKIKHVYMPEPLSRGEDLYFAVSTCNSLIITAKLSTYAWWIAYLAEELDGSVFYEPPSKNGIRFSTYETENFLPEWVPMPFPEETQ